MIHIKDRGIVNYVAWNDFLKELKEKDGDFLVKFELRKKRSLSQNNYYFAVLPLILKGLHDIGYNDIRDTDDVHYLLKVMFLKRPIVNHSTGEVIGEISRSTTELNTQEFSEYIERIAQWCSEYLGFALPLPNQQLSIHA